MFRGTKISSFALRVYKVVLEIPLGEVRTYKWVAQRIGCPKAYRAVGQVLRTNPFPLIIPCHRVVGSKKIGGYIFGKKIKQKLIEIERQIKKQIV